VLAAAGLTQLVFPVWWPSLLAGSTPVTGLLVARNVLLVTAAVLSCWRVAAASSLGREDLPPSHQHASLSEGTTG
jgi:hypothetical protein